MDLEEKIAAFLRANLCCPICDDCIGKQVRATIEDVRLATLSLKPKLGFVAATTTCMRCHHRKPTIRAV
jgi:hypothetical protein